MFRHHLKQTKIEREKSQLKAELNQANENLYSVAFILKGNIRKKYLEFFDSNHQLDLMQLDEMNYDLLKDISSYSCHHCFNSFLSCACVAMILCCIKLLSHPLPCPFSSTLSFLQKEHPEVKKLESMKKDIETISRIMDDLEKLEKPQELKANSSFKR